MSEFLYQGFRIDAEAEVLQVDHGYYGPNGTLTTRNEILRSEITDVSLDSDGLAVTVNMRSRGTFRFGPMPGLEGQNIFWIERIGLVTPYSVEGGYAAQVLALYDAICAVRRVQV